MSVSDERCLCRCGKGGCVSRRKSGVVKHGASGYTMGCRCETCTSTNTVKQLRQRAKVNSETLVTATHRREPWTGPQLEFIMRPDLTAREAAVRIGRTMQAVKNMRFKCRNDPKYAALLGAPTDGATP